MENEESDVVCEKIISEIDAVFTKDPNLLTFDIIPQPTNQNKSPVIHVESHLGLESWCTRHVYIYSHDKILQNKLENRRHLNRDILKYLNCAILINPDVSTFWNVRRKLCGNNKLSITKEFQFSAIVLSRKPKSNEAFFYRRWLFSFRSEESNDWTFELKLCERCADKSSSNYHAWCHRQWVLEKAPHLMKFEPHQSEKFIRKHIGDYSGYHHRQYLLNRFCESNNLFEINGVQKTNDNNYEHLREYIYSILSLNTNNHINTSSSSSSNMDTNSVTTTTTTTSLVDITADMELLKFILPNIDIKSISENRIKSFLYCLNFAAYDLRFCDELSEMFGNREAFELHRKSMIKFIVDKCLLYNNNNNNNDSTKNQLSIHHHHHHHGNGNIDDNDDHNNIDHRRDHEDDDQKPPRSKMVKIDLIENQFLNAIKQSEHLRGGDKYQKWCKIFLGF